MRDKHPETIQDICEIFWGMEEKYNLLDVDIQGIKAWQTIRFSTYRYVSELTNLQEQAHSKLTTFGKLKKLSLFILNSIFHNPFFRKKCDVVIFSHPRSKLVNGENIDIYTKYFIDDLKKQNINFLELESALLGEHNKDLNPYTTYTDFIVLMTNLFKKFIPIRLSKDEEQLIENINLHLSDRFDAEVDISNLLFDNIRVFKIKNYYYKKLLKKLSPHTLYIVVSYGNADIIKAAKDLNIKVIELQHGIFSEFHLGYSYPNRTKELDYFPDEFLVWNHYWKDLMKLPIDYNSIKIKPFEFLENNRKKYKNIKKSNQIVILSQGNIGNKIASFVLDNIKIFQKIKIVYKLHPGEYDRYKNYESLNALVKSHQDIEVVEDIDLHMLLASSKYQLGVNSTALLEGVEFGCKTILLNISGIEYMKKFIKFYNLIEIDNLLVDSETIMDLNI